MSLVSYFDRKSVSKREHVPGDAVPYSGIYQVTHQQAHVPDHNVTCVSGRLFPRCAQCGSGVRFKLVKAARLIDKHDLFGKPGTGQGGRPWWVKGIATGEPEIV